MVAVADVAGKVITEYDYDPFGKLEDDENEWLKILFGIYVEDNNPFRYCAEYYDSETEFIYLRARYYSPGSHAVQVPCILVLRRTFLCFLGRYARF